MISFYQLDLAISCQGEKVEVLMLGCTVLFGIVLEVCSADLDELGGF
jgi:hypothetical protein